MQDLEKIAIQKENKCIYVEYFGSGFMGNIIEENALTILFDLIQAGMVEKVERE